MDSLNKLREICPELMTGYEIYLPESCELPFFDMATDSYRAIAQRLYDLALECDTLKVKKLAMIEELASARKLSEERREMIEKHRWAMDDSGHLVCRECRAAYNSIINQTWWSTDMHWHNGQVCKPDCRLAALAKKEE